MHRLAATANNNAESLLFEYKGEEMKTKLHIT